MSNEEILAKLDKISLSINQQKILENINLEIKKGEIITLIGPNGGGKTSIARVLLEILTPSKGKVTKKSDLNIGYMPQRINFDKTIPIKARDFINLSCSENYFDEEFFYYLSKRLRIENILNHQIHDLSGGQLQKIIFLRTIIHKPELLVLDEPTQYMDISATEDFYKILDEVRKKTNCAILMISHDLITVMQKTDLVFCINNHICCHGSPEDVNQHPEYLSLFGNRTNLAIYQHHHDHKH